MNKSKFIPSTNKYYFDKGLELFGFGGPKNGQQETSPVFGRLVYIEKYKQWYTEDYVNMPQKYMVYNNKNIWCHTWIDDPYKKLEKVAGISRYLFTTKLERTVQWIVEAVNSVEDEDGTFNATADVDTVVKGNDKRFAFVMLEVFNSKYDGPTIALQTVFNRRIFWFVVTEKSCFTFIPNSPSIMNAVSPNANITDTNKAYSIHTVFDPSLPFSSPNQKVHTIKKAWSVGREELEADTPIEGEYDKDNTDVTVNPSQEDTVADVDVRIDLTPDREQKLLRMFSYNIDTELDVYGLEGLKHKSLTIDSHVEKYFDKYFSDLDSTIQKLAKTKNDNITFISNRFITDITNKEMFYDTLKDNYRKLNKMFLTIKKFADEDIIDENALKELENEQVEEKDNSQNNNTTMTMAHFTDKDDLTYLGNQLLSGKSKIKLSQYKFYKNKILDKLENVEYACKYSDTISNIINTFNVVFINTANTLSQGKRFIENVVMDANS